MPHNSIGPRCARSVRHRHCRVVVSGGPAAGLHTRGQARQKRGAKQDRRERERERQLESSRRAAGFGESPSSELDFLTQQNCRHLNQSTTAADLLHCKRGQRTCHWANGKGTTLEALLAVVSHETSQQPLLFIDPLTNYVAEIVY